MKFMLGQDGPHRRPPRENMAKLVRGARHQVEVWIVYADQKRPGRRVAWGSRNRETGWISLPVPRTQVKVKSREDGTPAARWAPSTHNTAWTDVPPVHWRNLPTITSKDKKEVFPNNGSASTPPAKDSVQGRPGSASTPPTERECSDAPPENDPIWSMAISATARADPSTPPDQPSLPAWPLPRPRPRCPVRCSQAWRDDGGARVAAGGVLPLHNAIVGAAAA